MEPQQHSIQPDSNGDAARLSPTVAEYRALKVPELKDLLKHKGLPISGKKDDLIARLVAADTVIADQERASQAQSSTGVDGAEQQEVAPFAEAAAVIPGRSSHAREEEEEEAAPERPSKRAKLEEAVVVVDALAVAPVAEHAGAAVYAASSVLPPAMVVQETPLIEAEERGNVESVPQPKEVVEEDEPPEYHFEPEVLDLSSSDMYLDTINRSALDFDFERLCSVTLSQNNIYACLVDGKYFQGRGRSSPAFAHSIAEDKHVFINMSTLKVYILPDGYEVTDPSLDDIKYLLYPTFTPSLLQRIDHSLSPTFDLSQTPYYPGFVGLNNIKANSYMNAILHALVHVIPLRDYFILNPLTSDPGATELVKRFSMFCRKVWNPKAFKGQVSPHELLQECANASAGRFKITEVGDPLEFLSWLLNRLHMDLGGTRKPRSSIIYSAFQGEIKIDDQQVLTTGEFGGKPRFDLDRDVKSIRTPFLLLAIDLPAPPLFQDAIEKNIIPQVSISTVLAKYDGVSTQEIGGLLRRYKITRLPPFLILHMKRFTKNSFVEEKNATIVNFPLRGVDMKDYVDPSSDLSAYYDLVSNITHSSAAGTARSETTWKTQVHLRPERGADGQLMHDRTEEDERWFQIQDLIVEEINRGMISIGESYIQIWERRTGASTADVVVEPPKLKTKGLSVVA